MMVACVTALSSARLTETSPDALVWVFIVICCGTYTAYEDVWSDLDPSVKMSACVCIASFRVPVLQNCKNWFSEFAILDGLGDSMLVPVSRFNPALAVYLDAIE